MQVFPQFHVLHFPRDSCTNGFPSVLSVNGCTLLFGFVTMINTGYLSVSSVFIRKIAKQLMSLSVFFKKKEEKRNEAMNHNIYSTRTDSCI